MTPKMNPIQKRIVSNINKDNAIELTKVLVGFKTVNPPGNERECAEYIAEKMKSLGLSVKLEEKHTGRGNCVATIKGSKGKPTLIFNGHIDVVAPGDGWQTDPFKGVVINDKIYGRGTSDMKAGIAAMMTAIESLVEAKVELQGDLVFTAVADEESLGPLGTKFLVEQGLRGDMAIVGEPTNMQVETAERGVLWTEIITEGKSAHGGRPWLGINAIYKMNEVINALRKLEQELGQKRHPLVRSPTISVNVINGGNRINVVPDSCSILVDRRTIPGESIETAIAEINGILEKQRSEDPSFKASLRIINCAEAFEISQEETIVQSLSKAIHLVTGQRPRLKGKDACTDAHILVTKAGIPTALFGPGLAETAHTNCEYVEITNIVEAAKVYALVAHDILA
jgi:acetylornithine deacetylase/succinyl-diaminopimelate desuccinylase family protein